MKCEGQPWQIRMARNRFMANARATQKQAAITNSGCLTVAARRVEFNARLYRLPDRAVYMLM
eukprot:10599120-Lingulodinium_polyedra.AAC.1